MWAFKITLENKRAKWSGRCIGIREIEGTKKLGGNTISLMIYFVWCPTVVSCPTGLEGFHRPSSCTLRSLRKRNISLSCAMITTTREACPEGDGGLHQGAPMKSLVITNLFHFFSMPEIGLIILPNYC